MYYFSLLVKKLIICLQCYHDILKMPIDVNSTAILNIHSVDYPCIIIRISKSKAINLLKNADFSENSASL